MKRAPRRENANLRIHVLLESAELLRAIESAAAKVGRSRSNYVSMVLAEKLELDLTKSFANKSTKQG